MSPSKPNNFQSPKPKILIIWSSYELGGAEQQLLRLANDWRHHNFQVEFLGFFGGSLRAQLNQDGFVTHLASNLHRPTLIWRFWRKVKLLNTYYQIVLTRKLRRILPDIVVSAMNFPNVMIGNLWPKIKSIKGHIWNQSDLGLGRLPLKLEKKALSNASFIVTNSQISANFLLNEFSPQFSDNLTNFSSKIKTIPNIISLNRPPSSLNEYRSSPNQFIAVMVANLSQYKDHQLLLKAWARFNRQLTPKNLQFHPPLLLLAGRDDGQKSHLEKLAQELNIAHQVRFLGSIRDVDHLLAIADLAILTTPSEGSSNSLAEYMLFGLSIITSDIPANQELLNPEYQFYYSPNSSRTQQIHSVAQHLQTFYTRPQLRSKIGQQNQYQAHQIFNNQYNLKRYRDLLLSILKQN